MRKILLYYVTLYNQHIKNSPFIILEKNSIIKISSMFFVLIFYNIFSLCQKKKKITHTRPIFVFLIFAAFLDNMLAAVKQDVEVIHGGLVIISVETV